MQSVSYQPSADLDSNTATGGVSGEETEIQMRQLRFKIKITGGTPEVRSDKSLILLTFDIWFLTFDIPPMDQWSNGPIIPDICPFFYTSKF